MKKTVLALVLVIAIVLSCVGTAFAAPMKTEINAVETNKTAMQTEKENKGFKSELFREANTYRYADDALVRAIVVLESAPEADVAENGSEKAATYRVKLQNEHNTVRKAMRSIDYKLVYEFTTLLNGFSCDVAYGDLDTIAAIDGVAAVYIANSYSVPVLAEPQNEGSGAMTDNTFTNMQGITGKGTVVAVLDTGLRTTHEAFQDYGMTADTLTEEDLARAVAPGAYLNAKVPFAYDYADKDADVTDTDGHGTHVSGTAVGYAENEEGAILMSGAAPGAQLLSMKIFSDGEGGTTSDIYFFALEDAYRMGADVINMSIGAPGGFTYDSSLETEIFGNIYARLEASGVIMCVSAGNEYSMDYYSSVGFTGPEYTDYGTVSAPSTYSGNISVASVNNIYYPQFAMTVGEGSFSYVDTSDDGLWLTNFGGKTVEYVIVTDAEGNFSLGTAEDYANVNVTGKIAVVSRGELDFETKVENAANAGASGCIVVNNEPGTIAMSIESFEIPAVSVQLSARELLLAGNGTVTVYAEAVNLWDENGYLMSDFSNWGTSPDLTIAPTITSVGGNVYSSVNTGDSDYEIYSGTSMASPNAAGTFALVMSYLKNSGKGYDKAELAEHAKAILESTGIIINDAEGYMYSVRKQGAGLANSYHALNTYANAAYILDPIKELGHDPEKTGVFTFDVTLVNEAAATTVTYDAFETVLMGEYLALDDNDNIVNTLTTDYYYYSTESSLSDTTVTYKVNGAAANSVTLAPGETATVTVTITLGEDVKNYFDTYFTNGAYVEGYVMFSNSDAYATHATYLGYYGDWTQAPVLEELNSFDLLAANYIRNTKNVYVDENGEEYTYAELGYGPYDALAELYGNFYTDVNTVYALDYEGMKLMAYLGANLMEDINTYQLQYRTEHLSFSTPEADGTWTWFDGLYVAPFQLRNAERLVMTVSDKETGEIYFVDDTEYLSKAAFDTLNGIWQNYGAFMWNGTDADGDYLPTGTVATVTFDAMLPYEDTWQEDIWSFDVTIDSTAPVIEEIDYMEEYGLLMVTASDENYLSSIYLANEYYEIVESVNFSSDVKGESGTAFFDLSEYEGDAIYVVAMDYASNEYEELTPLFNAGKEAKVNFITPEGIETVECLTGDYISMPNYVSTQADYEFYFWTDVFVEEPLSAYWELLYVNGGMYFAGDQILIADEEVNFYAFLAHGSNEPLEIINYYGTQAANYAGDWAIVGLNVDVDGDILFGAPQVLNSELEQVDVAAAFDDAVVGDWYIEFSTNNSSPRFTLENAGENAYTVKSYDTGKYMTLGDKGLYMADEVTDASKWTISPDPLDRAGVASLMFNYAQPDMLLTYDYFEEEFAVYDNTEYLDLTAYGITASYYPTEVFTLNLYKCAETQFVIENFVTLMPEAKPGTCYWETFTDCPADWYHDAVDYVVSEGLMTGVGNNKFAPSGTLTRAMMVTILYRAAGSPAVAEPSTFTDVDAGQWYSDAIAWAQDNGIVAGTTETTFAPDQAVTREQIATILWRYVDEPAAEADMSRFGDAEATSDYAKAAMQWAVSEGLFLGDSNGKLNPGSNATRAEFATLMMRFLDGAYHCENKAE